MSANPFEIIESRLDDIEALLIEIRGLPPQNISKPSDRIGLSEVCVITGYQKSVLYKKTMTGDIPYKKFGKRLVFSRKKIAEWMEARTIASDF